MEARKNPKTDAQRDQYLAVCRHTHDNIIFNYGSVENYIVAKNTEINTAESKLQSYYDNPRKGKSRRPAIIAGLENTIFIMKNSLTNALRDLEELDAARATETPQISTETAETVNVSEEGEKEDKPRKIDQIKIRRVYGDMFCVSMYVDGKLVDCENGITESQKDKIQNLFDNGKLFASIQPPQSPETPKTVKCTAEPRKLAQTA